MDPDGAPPLSYLRGAAVSYPLSLLAQALLWRALWADALGDAVRAGSIAGFAGHSQGLLAALLVAEAPGGAVSDALLAAHLERAAVQGLCLSAAACGRSPMAAIDGVSVARLEPLLAELDACVALVNTPTRLVVSGAPAALDVLRVPAGLARGSEEALERRDGRRGGAPLSFSWSFLNVDVPFHSPALAGPLAAFSARVGEVVARCGRRCSGVVGGVARSQFVEPVRWDAVAAEIAGLGADWVLDLGPGTAIARLTAENLRGTGVRTLALASPEGRRVLTSPGAAPAGRDVTYASLAPGVVDAAGRATASRHALHAADRAPAGDPRRDDADDGRRADRRRRRERRLHGRAGGRRAAGSADVLAAGRGVGVAARAGARGRVQHAAARPPPLGAARRARGAAVRSAAGGCAARRADGVGGHPGRRRGARAARPAGRGGHAPERVQARHRRAGAAAAGDRRRRAAPHDRRAPRGWPRRAGITRGRTSRSCCSRPTTSCAGGRTCWCARAVASARRRAPPSCCAGRGRWRTGRSPMPVDAVLVGTAAMACLEAAASPQVKAALVGGRRARGWVRAAAASPAASLRPAAT